MTALACAFFYACAVAGLALCVADAYQRARRAPRPVQAKPEPEAAPSVIRLYTITLPPRRALALACEDYLLHSDRLNTGLPCDEAAVRCALTEGRRVR